MRAYQRGYKACEACRKRKIRCDLGGNDQDVFAFVGPPCAYCRRTRQECIFRQERASRVRSREHDLVQPSSVSPFQTQTERRAAAPIQQEATVDHAGKDPTSYSGHPADPVNLTTSVTSLVYQPRIWPELRVSDRSQRQRPLRAKARLPIASAHSNMESESVYSHNLGLTSHGGPIKELAQAQKSRFDKVIMQTMLSKGNDSLDILVDSAECHTQLLHGNSSDSPARSSVAPLLKMSTVSPALIESWSAFGLVQSGLLTVEEAVAYVDA